MVHIFDIEGGELKINENCYMIPELTDIINEYSDDPIPALKYVYLLTSPNSPYNNLPEKEKLEAISDDVGGDFGLEDEVIEKAIKKLKHLFETPAMRFKNAHQIMMDKMSKYLSSAQIEAGRDGNLAEIHRMQSTASKTLDAFKALEKVVEEELKAKLRGKAKQGRY